MVELLVFLALIVAFIGIVFDKFTSASGKDRQEPPRPW